MLSIFTFERIRLKGMLLLALPLGFACALILTISEQLIHPDQYFSVVDFLQNVSVYSACTLLALLFAEQCKLEGFLLKRSCSWLKKVTLMLVYGGLTGIAMGLVYNRWYALYGFSARARPFRLRRMTTFYDSFILSLSAAVTEELVFRLLLFTSFLWILGWLFRPILTMNGFNRWIPLVFAVVFSSMLFGLVHGVYGFLFAFGAGATLCLIFLRGGLESAVLAHFLANLVFFNLTYLR
jgi:membrane protease YdiL (CAAX protease family)